MASEYLLELPDRGVYKNVDPKDFAVFSTRLTPAVSKVSRNFRLSEFQSNDGEHIVVINRTLPAFLEDLRNKLDEPITVVRAFSTESHNDAIKGAPDSKHLYGMAADVWVRDVDSWSIAIDMHELDAGGVGVGPSRVHGDLFGEGRRWIYNTLGEVEVMPVDDWEAYVREKISALLPF